MDKQAVLDELKHLWDYIPGPGFNVIMLKSMLKEKREVLVVKEASLSNKKKAELIEIARQEGAILLEKIQSETSRGRSKSTAGGRQNCHIAVLA